MPGSGSRLRLVTLTTLFTLALLAACGRDDAGDAGPPTAPSPTAPDVAGTWTFVDSLGAASEMQLACREQGLLLFASAAGAVAGEMRQVATCVMPALRIGNARRRTMPVTVAGDSVRFAVTKGGLLQDATCTYTGRVAGRPADTMAGTVACTNGATGTWRATRGEPTAASVGPVAALATGNLSTCALTAAGRAVCWGANAFGELGTGDDVARLVPTAVLPGLTLASITISPGSGIACGVTTAGQAYCWGNRGGPRLGDGVTGPPWSIMTTPVAVAGGLTFTQLVAGGDHVCGIVVGGDAYCWGQNDSGQLGIGRYGASSVPLPVAGGHKFRTLSAHLLLTCGVTLDGAAYCWGDDLTGALGDGGAVESSPVPVRVAGGLAFRSIAAGWFHACGVTVTDDAYCWGQNGAGELGTGRVGGVVATPAKVAGGIAWRSISAGVSVTCGVSTVGRGYCWGGNLSGERGDGTTAAPDVATPTPIAGDLTLASIHADWHVCALTTSGGVVCWGPGHEGSLGDGTLLDRAVPTRPRGLP